MRSTSLIDKTSTLCEANSVLISERKTSVLLIFPSTSVKLSGSVGDIITLITANPSLDLVEVYGVIPTKLAFTDDNGTLLAAAIVCSKMSFISEKLVSSTPFSVRLKKIGQLQRRLKFEAIAVIILVTLLSYNSENISMNE